MINLKFYVIEKILQFHRLSVPIDFLSIKAVILASRMIGEERWEAHEGNLFSIEPGKSTNGVCRDRKPNGVLLLLFLSLSLSSAVESLPRKRRLISRGKRAALNSRPEGEKGGTIALAKTRDSITSKTWGKRAASSA